MNSKLALCYLIGCISYLGNLQYSEAAMVTPMNAASPGSSGMTFPQATPQRTTTPQQNTVSNQQRVTQKQTADPYFDPARQIRVASRSDATGKTLRQPVMRIPDRPKTPPTTIGNPSFNGLMPRESKRPADFESPGSAKSSTSNVDPLVPRKVEQQNRAQASVFDVPAANVSVHSAIPNPGKPQQKTAQDFNSRSEPPTNVPDVERPQTGIDSPATGVQPMTTTPLAGGQFQPEGQFQPGTNDTATDDANNVRQPATITNGNVKELVSQVSPPIADTHDSLNSTHLGGQQNSQPTETKTVNRVPQQDPVGSNRLLKTPSVSTYQSIEPESVSSNSNLLGPREIAKLPSKAKGEFFESGATLAIVGGEPIFAADLMLEANQLIEKFMAAAPENIKDQQRKQIIPKLLKKYIESKLFYVDILRGLPEPAAKGQIFETLGDHFDREMLPKIVKENKLKTAAEFDAQLRAQGVSLRQFRQRWIEDEFVRYFLKDKIEVDPDVNHQEMLDYYHANEDQYRRKERARWEQIMVSFANHSDRKEARRKIAELGNEIVYGASFQAVAKKSSDGLKAAKGGQQGWVNRGSLVSDELDKAIFSIPLSRLSDIIETRTGFHIIRVLEREPAGLKPFLEAQTEIRNKIKEQKRLASFQEHLKRLRREIPVEILHEQAKVELASYLEAADQ